MALCILETAMGDTTINQSNETDDNNVCTGQLTSHQPSNNNISNCNVSSNEGVRSLSSQAELKRQKNQRRITKTFFIVGVVFMTIAVPMTIAANSISIPVTYSDDVDSGDIIEIFVVILRLPYCFVALINPFLYAFSNPTVTKRLKKVAQNVCCCCGQLQSNW